MNEIHKQLGNFRQMTTNRLILRPVTLDDAAAMFEYTSDPQVTAYVTFLTQTSLEETIAGLSAFFLADPLGKWGIELKTNHKMIGTIDFRLNDTETVAEIGYALNRHYWGQELMPEAANRLLQLGFCDLAVPQRIARHNFDNPKSGRVMQKIGMHQTEVIKHAKQVKGEWVDVALYSITRSEYLV